MLNFYYNDTIESFLQRTTEEIIGFITMANQFDSNSLQNKSWEQQIKILKESLTDLDGTIFFEFSIPRMGKRVDVIVIIENVIFIIEFKVGEEKFLSSQIEQVWDYALDLKNFHKPSHTAILVPILIATEAKKSFVEIISSPHNDNTFYPVKSNRTDLGLIIRNTIQYFKENLKIDPVEFAKGSYYPTPTIIEAAVSLYNNHSVEEITRSDASAKNLTLTTSAISDIIKNAKEERKKVICFVTGVPGAGKTLVGLKIATQHLDNVKGDASVYLSGNAPLVAILQEALARDKVNREINLGRSITKSNARQAVKSFIQIIHHYRDAYLVNPEAPYDHVAIFDEAQRAWNREQTIKFMQQKKNQHDFKYSEPEFLISCLNRHKDWAVIVCLVGGGQEINTGEAGISEWLKAIETTFMDWTVYISPNLIDSEYNAIEPIERLKNVSKINFNQDLHLGVSMRSFRAENLSMLIKNILDLDIEQSKITLSKIQDKYPILITRNLFKAKAWLKNMARGSERYGIIVSSQAQRLKPFAIDVKSPMNPVHWFLEGKDDVRSSFYLEDVATEFQVQGLELDWSCVTWDGDLRYSSDGWKTYSFKGNRWENVNKDDRKKYLINAYRVLLTRARQGMIIVVPEGDSEDHTRKSEYYDSTYFYLKSIGLKEI